MSNDYYALLGVRPDASEDELKRAYRKLARQLHPDANGGDAESEARFKEVTLAYETLRDPERRRRYDMFGPESVPGSGAAGTGAAAGDMGAFFTGGLGGLFDAFFGATQGSHQQSRDRFAATKGPDVEASCSLSFEEAIFGTRKDVSARELVTCSVCSGSGAQAGTKPTACPECRGTGEIRRVRNSLLGQMVMASPCQRCRGTGQVIANPCPACRGAGRQSEMRTFSVDVPAGVDEGAILRLAGRGSAGVHGGPPGDLYVHLSVQPHPTMRRNGTDLELLVHVSMTQAALGAEVKVDTLEGPEPLVIAPGTQSGQVVKLRGRGVPHLGGRGRGSLVVTLVVDTPTGCSGEQEELLRRLAELRKEPVMAAHDGLISRLKSAFG